MIQRKNPPCLGMADFGLLRGGGSKPAFAAGDVGVDELLIGLGEINDSFDESDDSEEPACHEADDQLDDAFLAITKDKLVGTGPSKKDAEETSEHFFFGTGRGGGYRFCGHCSSPLLSRCGQCKPQAL